VPLPTTPLLATDVVLVRGERLLVVERAFPPLGYSLPGGFVEVGERLEEAAAREMLEETGLAVVLDDLLGCYSDPARDPRRHVVSVVYVAHAEGEPRAGDDARSLRWVPLGDPPSLVFDHARIVADYRRYRDDPARYRRVGSGG
jgi:8-oxo-dGTP diphosphatase